MDQDTFSKPLSTGKQALIYAVLGTGVGAAVDTCWQVITNMASKSNRSLDKARIMGFAISMGILSAVIGFCTGSHENKEQEQYKPLSERLPRLTTKKSSELLKEYDKSKPTNEVSETQDKIVLSAEPTKSWKETARAKDHAIQR